MRTSQLSFAFAALLAAGCGRGGSPSPAPAPAPAHASPAHTAPVAAKTAPAAPVSIVYTAYGPSGRQVHAVLEDGSEGPVTLSTEGMDSTFAGALPGHRALLVEHSEEGAVARILAVHGDGSSRATLATFAAGAYRSVASMKAEGDVVAVELLTGATARSDVYSLAEGRAPILLAEGATLVTSARGRVVFVQAGTVKSALPDGSGALVLGHGDGHDRVVETSGGMLLLTLHADTAGDVRLVGVDGSGAVDFGAESTDESAFAIAGDRVLFSRRSAEGASVVSAGIADKVERVLAASSLDATPLLATAGKLFFGSAGGALLSVSLAGSVPLVLDPAAGENLTVGQISGDRIVYVGDAKEWRSLRSAKLDGSGVSILCERLPWLPFFSGIGADGDVVFYRALAGQPEGGRVYTVPLAGGDIRPVATTVVDLSGPQLPGGPADQDFEAITPSGRLIIETEFEAAGQSHLLVANAVGNKAQRLTPATAVRFAGLLP